MVAALALGIGAGFKLYPMMFALPVALWLGTGGWRPAAGSDHPVRAPAGSLPRPSRPGPPGSSC